MSIFLLLLGKKETKTVQMVWDHSYWSAIFLSGMGGTTHTNNRGRKSKDCSFSYASLTCKITLSSLTDRELQNLEARGINKVLNKQTNYLIRTPLLIYHSENLLSELTIIAVKKKRKCFSAKENALSSTQVTEHAVIILYHNTA